jgi:hypothetical protein
LIPSRGTASCFGRGTIRDLCCASGLIIGVSPEQDQRPTLELLFNNRGVPADGRWMTEHDGAINATAPFQQCIRVGFGFISWTPCASSLKRIDFQEWRPRPFQLSGTSSIIYAAIHHLSNKMCQDLIVKLDGNRGSAFRES